MSKPRNAIFAVTMIAALGSMAWPHQAQAALRDVLFANHSDKAVWFTIYDNNRRSYNYGAFCVNARSSTTRQVGKGENRWILAEFKQTKDDCRGPNSRTVGKDLWGNMGTMAVD